ncbi:hypothetical protein BCR44DRAFT_1010863 [Catenaria anguillulae PL171]|uniref:Uncharacterized protein n=1 Tax=Catenaria anguillulae PL171 TaxID=765915 RepID=A0A1Y2I422_9FUNG|nr:hypothetical protein BCR44DRAFT_1010863 [Catenaria anguillulae PL171]
MELYRLACIWLGMGVGQLHPEVLWITDWARWTSRMAMSLLVSKPRHSQAVRMNAQVPHWLAVGVYPLKCGGGRRVLIGQVGCRGCGRNDVSQVKARRSLFEIATLSNHQKRFRCRSTLEDWVKCHQGCRRRRKRTFT